MLAHRRPILALLLTLAIAAAASAAETAMTDEERGALSTAFGENAVYDDPPFDELIERMRGWGFRVAQWAAAGKGPLATLVTPPDLDRLIHTWPESAGELVEISGRFIERQVAPKKRGVERWLVAPIDPQTGQPVRGPAYVLFTPISANAARLEPSEGWSVRAVGYFYRPLELISRSSSGEEIRVYPGFVGAIFASSPTSGVGAAGSRLFEVGGLALAVLIAVFITLVVIVARMRSSDPRHRTGRGRSTG